MTTSEDTQTLEIERPFNWGVVLLSDPQAQDIPELSRTTPFSSSRRALGVAVRHSQDVDFEAMDLGPDDAIPPATVSVRVHPGEHEVADFACVLELPNGELHVGDADHEDVLGLPPGRYKFSVTLDDLHHAEAVDVRLSPVR